MFRPKIKYSKIICHFSEIFFSVSIFWLHTVHKGVSSPSPQFHLSFFAGNNMDFLLREKTAGEFGQLLQTKQMVQGKQHWVASFLDTCWEYRSSCVFWKKLKASLRTTCSLSKVCQEPLQSQPQRGGKDYLILIPSLTRLSFRLFPRWEVLLFQKSLSENKAFLLLEVKIW